MARVLLIDDEPDLLFLSRMALEDVGHVVETLSGNSRVMAVIGAFRPDLIGLDWVMPEGGGEAMLAMLRGTPETKAIPVLVISALEGLDARARGLGAAAVLHKPFWPETLVAAIGEVLASRRAGEGEPQEQSG